MTSFWFWCELSHEPSVRCRGAVPTAGELAELRTEQRPHCAMRLRLGSEFLRTKPLSPDDAHMRCTLFSSFLSAAGEFAFSWPSVRVFTAGEWIFSGPPVYTEGFM